MCHHCSPAHFGCAVPAMWPLQDWADGGHSQSLRLLGPPPQRQPWGHSQRWSQPHGGSWRRYSPWPAWPSSAAGKKTGGTLLGRGSSWPAGTGPSRVPGKRLGPAGEGPLPSLLGQGPAGFPGRGQHHSRARCDPAQPGCMGLTQPVTRSKGRSQKSCSPTLLIFKCAFPQRRVQLF